MVFIGNIDNVRVLVKTSHLLVPFPEIMIDAAFLIASMHIAQGGKFPRCGQNSSPIRMV